MVASYVASTGDLACNPGMYPEWELNWQHFDLQARAQSTEPHQPGLFIFFKRFFLFRVFLLFFKDFIYLFLDRGEGREKERERNINV